MSKPGGLRRALTLALALAVFLLASAAFAETPRKANVNSEDVNLREEASRDSAVLAKLRRGTEVTVLSKQDKWVYVSYGKDKGYVREEWLDLKSMPKECVGKGKINADDTNVRVKPFVNAKILTQLKKGVQVEFTERIDNWYFITSGKTKGYVRLDYIDVISITTEGEFESDYDTYKMGMSGTPIAKLQNALKALKFFSGEVNGSYGAVTREAVKAFQAAYGLKENGVADAETQRLVYEVLYSPTE